MHIVIPPKGYFSTETNIKLVVILIIIISVYKLYSWHRSQNILKNIITDEGLLARMGLKTGDEVRLRANVHTQEISVYAMSATGQEYPIGMFKDLAVYRNVRNATVRAEIHAINDDVITFKIRLL